jgi:hypothetical protein
MRNHDECEEAINAALARNNHGQAMFLAARCDLHHGPQLAREQQPPTAPPAPTETEPETEPAAGAVGSGGLG